MKRNVKILILAGVLTACLAGPIPARPRADRQRLSHPDAFSMILLGDPQGYMKNGANQPLFELCTAWIADNLDSLRIKAVLCTGDLVEHNDNFVVDRHKMDQTGRQMWKAVSRCFERLDNRVPYIISTGNHDYGFKAAEHGNSFFSDYFPMERNEQWRQTCIGMYPDRKGEMSVENAAFAFHLPHWGDILIVTTEFAPRDEVLEWIGRLVSDAACRDYRVFFLTHSYLGRDNERFQKDASPMSPKNTGEEIWQKLIRRCPNIRLVLCGHAGSGNGRYEDNVAFRTDLNDAGIPVPQMMFNVQNVGGGSDGNGGDGWLRILEFMPDGKTLKVRTYSPLFGISALTKHLAHRTESFDEFEIYIP